MIDPAIYLDVLQDRGGIVRPDPIAGLTTVRSEGFQSLPLRLALDATYEVVLIVPTGTARLWTDAPADALVTSAEFDRQPVASSQVEQVRLDRGARLLVMGGRRLLGALPPSPGSRHLLPMTGAAELEIAVLDYRIDTVAMRGGVSAGTSLAMGWRLLEPVSSYHPPPVPKRVRDQLSVEFWFQQI
ncbi:hypothetical protein [Azospirillum sp.]|uniref:hypothetical protein n=1 Tax=Azospirillum sp. TaxID=34012 RepID=UPI002D51C946|nr:hypothetical protein [Azospirillum sp.]HYF90100.1 hypothetical protein [Azospirillum sp.]